MFHFIQDKKYHNLFKKYVENKTSFSLQDILGNGSYGFAYLLLDEVTGNQYVLKRMRAKHRNDDKQRAKFQQEITMLKELDIPNVPNILYDGVLEDIPFYIMDFVNGSTFEQAIFEEGITFSLKESLAIVKDLLEIVNNIHQKGIVHRDLRIPNILIQHNILYIIDFGLAAYIKDDTRMEDIENPKKIENHWSDLYYIGHFLLYLLYSNYSPTERKERRWQEELELPPVVEEYIERLLLIQQPFSTTEEAIKSIPTV
ncbi:serine/threonine protein kinase [Ureibacillus massiliensis 4400831 = CIP 108448 = CCUG 49529]|uniref:Serine/threonine protein kinase n=1 Tax=Ureibacillus massiliensis 4400831 = CIP 108448 = CCUG 49529 TaxID=1211035 RepID=A0A0A3J4Z4_9BACL|nr:protein kinase [Ureibacillus massiliensis]KGR90228.1 serine/threonine protein kinase [Ureibacillus massiliensis 4400831 = CIP 108448 = CCUG 49529]